MWLPTARSLALLLFIVAVNANDKSVQDLYWEAENGDANEFLDLKVPTSVLSGHLRNIRDTLWNIWDSSDEKATSVKEINNDRFKRNIDDTDEDAVAESIDDEDLSVGSGHGPPKQEITLRVSFVVNEPYTEEYSNRDSVQFQNLSRTLADAVNAVYDHIRGNQRASLVRIQSRPKDKFSCKVSMDLVTKGYFEVDKLKAVLLDHIRNNRRLGEFVVSDDEFSFEPSDVLGETCTDGQFRCDNDVCLPNEVRCNATVECADGSDERDCNDASPEFEWDSEPTTTTITSTSSGETINSSTTEPPTTTTTIESTTYRIDDTSSDWPNEEKTTTTTTTEAATYEYDDYEDNTTSFTSSTTEPVCPPTFHKCDRTRCILPYQVCDKRSDCQDGTDEANCDFCSQEEFKCDDGSCISSTSKCDHRNDCPDGEDEIDCDDVTTFSPPSNINCTDDQYLCDGINDCDDGYDERPELCGCDASEFRCKDGRECIKEELRCNGNYDCEDQSDEDCDVETDQETCKGNSFQCDNKECINRDFRCDNYKDCTDGSDEKDCNECQDDQWICGSRECISLSKKCDGYADCTDGSDESDCPRTPEPPIPEPRTPEPRVTQPPWLPEPRTPEPWVPEPRTPEPWVPEPRTPEPWAPEQRTPDPRVPIWTNNWRTPAPWTQKPPELEADNYALDLRIEDNSQEVKEGDDVVFRCRDYSYQRAPVIWVHEGGSRLPTKEPGRLELFNVTRADAGTYICRTLKQTSSSDISSKSVYLTVTPRKYTAVQNYIPPGCNFDEIKCRDGKCIPLSASCDGNPDCADGSDEMQCAPCEPNQFRCRRDNHCILVSWRCDSFEDCQDRSDELDCPVASPNDQCSSTQFRCSSGECIGRNLQCDGTNHCQDGSDEICTAIYIAKPPPKSELLSAGETMVISCTAVGVPAPVIVWRLNWGHLPKKCTYTNSVTPNGRGSTVVGTLTCPNVQDEDQGAYSCEAVNNKGSDFAATNTILTVRGSSPPSQTCPTGYFNSQAESQQDCISCFCFGVTTRCKSADLYTYQIPTPLGEGGTMLLGLVQNHLGQLVEEPIEDMFVYESRFRNEATVTKRMGAPQSDVHPYIALPESYNEMQLTSYGGYIKYNLRPHNRRAEHSNMPDIVIKGKYTTLVYHAPFTQDNYPRADIQREARLLPQYWSKVTGNGIIAASREDIMMALDYVDRIMLRADLNGGGVNITNFKMDSAQRENFGLGAANFVEECECPPGYSGLSCHKCDDGFTRVQSGPWLGLCKREDPICPPGTYGEPRRGIPCLPCPCPLTEPSNRFAGTCYIDSDSQITCRCQSGYEGRRCESCAPGLVGNPLVLGDSCRAPVASRCNPYGTENEINGRCICKQKVEGQYCDRCTKDSFLLSPDNAFGCAKCFCMGMTDQCGSSDLNRRAITTRFSSPQEATPVYMIKGSSARFREPVPANISPQQFHGGLVLTGLDRSQSRTYYWTLPESFNGNKVTSYGGYLTYTIKHWPAPTSQNVYNDPATVTIYSKNLINVHYFGEVTPTNEGTLNGTVQLIESNFRRSDGKPLQRSDFLMCLADVDKILVRATYYPSTEEANLVSASIDIAEDGASGPRAVHVEECRCPRNYTGTSCENCSPGYTRGSSGIYLANCEACNCNGHSSQCHPETGVCIDCQHNTAGEYCEECLPGYYLVGDQCVYDRPERPVYPPAEPSCNCDPRGEAGPCYSNGQCNCKTNVEGELCNVCRPGTFNLAANNPEGCLTCYCSGVTQECQSAHYYSRIPMPVFALNEQHGFTLQTIDADKTINDNIIFDIQYNRLGYTFGNYPPSDRFYWSLPILPGNRVTSYGGNLLVTQKFESGNYQETSDPAINVVLVSDDLTIYWTNPQTARSGESLKYQVPLRESQWRDYVDAQEISREQFLRVLSSLRRVLVLATLSPHVSSTYIADVSMDTAILNNNREPGNANEVEVCRCPTGYIGTSCEQCSPGWYRDQDKCIECPCNGNADSCQLGAAGEVICNCRLPYNGPDCTAVDSSSMTPQSRPSYGTTVTIVITKPLIQIFAIGSTVNYTCTAASRITKGPLRVSWKKDSGELPLGRSYTDNRSGLLVIQNVQVSDSGKYICVVNDGMTMAQDYVSLTVAPNDNTLPIARIEPSYKTVNEGDLIELECIVSGIPQPTITWVRAVGSVLPYNAQLNQGILRIENARISDSGEYRCLARNPMGSSEAIAVVYVANRPGPTPIQLTISPNQPNIQEGQNLQISCTSSDVDVTPDYLYWTREGDNFPDNFEVIDGTLHIRNAVPENNGVYVCQSTYPQSEITPVRVAIRIQPWQTTTGLPYDQPGVVLQTNTTSIPTGGNAYVECIPRGYPLPIIKWSKYDGDFGPSVSQRGNALIISQAEDSDRGYYICTATMPDGSPISDRAYLMVDIERRERPEVMIDPTGVQVVNLGTVFEIYCRVTKGYPDPVVTWSRKPSRAMSAYTKILPANILRFTNITLNDEGEYVCTASNSVGEASASASLSVQSPPRITITPENYILVDDGQPIRVDCRASGYPTPDVYWRRETPEKAELAPPTPGIASLVINRASSRDEGAYSCLAQSSAGKIQDQIAIVVNYKDIEEGSGIEPGIERRPEYPEEQPDAMAVYAPEGTRFEMNCQETYENDPDVEVRWSRIDGQPLSPYVTRGSGLHWNRITKEDEGVYQCSVVNRYTQEALKSSSRRLVVERQPRITLRPPSQVVRPGEYANVECVVDGDPPIEVTWQSATGYLSPRVQIDSNVLRFNRIEVEDAGTYICFARNRVANVTGTAEVKVTEHVSVPKTIHDHIQRAQVGSQVELSCNISDRRDVIWWTKDNRTLPKTVVRSDGSVKFSRVQKSDSGRYICHVKNSYGTTRNYVDLYIEEPSSVSNDRVWIERPRHPYTVGEDVTVTCRSSSPNIQVTWERPGPGGLNQYVNTKKAVGISVLDIPKVQLYDAGLYRCRGQNPYRQTFVDEFELAVERAPSTPSYPPEDQVIEAELGSTIRIACPDNGDPYIRGELRHEFGPVLNMTDAAFILRNITEADAGAYICRWQTVNHPIEARTILKVTRVVPMFQGSSWLALKPMLPSDIFSKLSFEISIKPQAGEGLILYNSENQGSQSDFIALRIINAVPEFQFNAGSGVVSLHGDRPLELNKWHTIRVNRNSNKLSMIVDNNGPFTETYDAFSGQGLELNEPIYIGGVPENTQLPASLNDVTPTGFVGCVSMLILNMEEKSLMREKIDDSGDLAECNTCRRNMCLNGGICQEAQNERGHSCLCKLGFAGLDCGRTGESCRPGICGPGKCTDTEDSYKCTCPNTHRGKNCEISQTITYPAFTGSAYLAFQPLKGKRTLKINMKIKPVAPVTDGIIMYCAESPDGTSGFTSLAVKDTYLEFIYNSNQSKVLRSPEPLKPYEWTEVAASRMGNKIKLTINNVLTVEEDLPIERVPMMWYTPLYIGGYDDKAVTLSKMINVTGGFNGCIKDVNVIPDKLDIKNAKGANVRECSLSDPQRGDIPYYELSTSANDIDTECQCRNNGQCRSDGSCICLAGYYGTLCEHRQPTQTTRDNCFVGLCQAGGTCTSKPQGYQCDCPLGYTGRNCESTVTLGEHARLQGNGYFALPANLLQHDTGRGQIVGMLVKTNQDGVLLFQHSLKSPPGSGQFILLRIENGMVTLNWNMGHSVSSVVHSKIITDNEEHSIILFLDGNSAILEVDREPVSGTISAATPNIDVDSEIYFGGIPSSLNWRNISGLNGCFLQIEFNEASTGIDIGQNAVSAVNVDRCVG